MSKKVLLRITCMMTAIVLTSGIIFSGCGKAGTEGTQTSNTTTVAGSVASASTEGKKALAPVELTWYMDGSQLEDLPKVVEEVNKITKEKINTTLNVKIIDWGNYDTKMNMIDASGEAYDLCFTSSWANIYRQAVSKGALLPLDDLLKQYGKTILAQVPEKYWASARIGGKIYGVLNYQTFTGQIGINIQTQYAKKYSFKPSSINKLEDLEPFLETIKQKEPGLYPTGICAGNGFDFTNNETGLIYECIGPMFDSLTSPASILHKGKDWKIVNTFEQKEYIDYANLMRKWYQKGYIRKDAATLKDFKAEWKTGKYVVTPCPNMKPGVEDEQKRELGLDFTIYPQEPAYINTDKIIATMTGISKNSKNPERAMMFYDLMYSDKVLYNTFIYGLEGEHYKKVSDNVIEIIKPYSQLAWMCGNQFNAYTTTSQSPTVWQDTIKKNEEAEMYRCLGFAFDETEVKNEYAACKAVYMEYMPLLMTGSVDPEKAIPEMIAKMNASGLKKLMDETQKQLDDWVKTNGK